MYCVQFICEIRAVVFQLETVDTEASTEVHKRFCTHFIIISILRPSLFYNVFFKNMYILMY